MAYEYMIVYSHPMGMGRICITRNKKIKSYSDVESLDETIKKYTGLNAIAIDFKLLRTYKQEDNQTNRTV
jgi:hypothetical protein